MKRYDKNDQENDSEEPRFIQADGDVLYRWSDPSGKKVRRWQIAFIALSAASLGTSIVTIPQEKILQTIQHINLALFQDVWSITLPLIALMIGFLFSRATKLEDAKESFQDIDQRAQTKERLRLEKRLKDLENLRNHIVHSPNGSQEKPKDFFEDYIQNIIQTLDKRSSLAEEKASKLLDTGTMYLRRGIYFYIASIFIWQVAFHMWPDTTGTNFMIYGVISCSLTFLVVEFLAAWFLKQYRSFTESSMQFVKVRSVFDRYLLAYYSLKEFSDESSKANTTTLMLKVLEEKAGWPDTAIIQADANHMVQMFSSFSDVLEKIKPLKTSDTGNKI